MRASTALLLFSLAAPLVAGVGCGSTDEGVGPTAPPTAEPPKKEEPPARAPITFTPCSLETGGRDGRAECADVEVPLDWAQPEGRKVTFFVKRLLGSAPGVHEQLWLLQGGPGGAGDGLETLVNELSKDPALDSFDIYVPDHRGTGRSAFLDCPEARKFPPFDYAGCAAEAEKAWGKEGFATFTTTTAAKDLGDTIERVRTPGQNVHVYGVSYGTYWAQRYLQLYPKQPAAVTLDSMCGPGLCNYLTIGYWFDRVGKKLMAECAADATCGAKLGPDPAAKVAEAIGAADKKTCAGLKGVNGDMLRQVFTWFVARVELRALIPAVVHRALRCNAEDVTALTTFVSSVRSMTSGGFSYAPSEDLSSAVLGFHIAFSEMTPSPMTTRAELSKMLEGAIFTKDDPSLYDAYESWPKYARDENVGKYPQTQAAMLLLNGTLDPQTPQEFAQEVSTHYTARHQTFLLLPRAAHGTISQSPVSKTKTDEACGMIVWKQFLASPAGPLDTTCKDRILPHDFSDTQPLAQTFFGVPSFWGLTRGPARRDLLVAPAHVRRELDLAMRATRPWVPVSVQRAELARAFERELGEN